MSYRNLSRSDASSRIILQLERLNDLLVARPRDTDVDFKPGLKYRRAEQHTQTPEQNTAMGQAISSIERLLKDQNNHYGPDAQPVANIGATAEDIDETVARLQDLTLEDDVHAYLTDIRTQLDPVLEDYRPR